MDPYGATTKWFNIMEQFYLRFRVCRVNHGLRRDHHQKEVFLVPHLHPCQETWRADNLRSGTLYLPRLHRDSFPLRGSQLPLVVLMCQKLQQLHPVVGLYTDSPRNAWGNWVYLRVWTSETLMFSVVDLLFKKCLVRINFINYLMNGTDYWRTEKS